MSIKDYFDIGAASCAILGAIFGVQFWSTRMAIKSALLELEVRMRDQYVTVTACRAICADCPGRRMGIAASDKGFQQK